MAFDFVIVRAAQFILRFADYEEQIGGPLGIHRYAFIYVSNYRYRAYQKCRWDGYLCSIFAGKFIV